MCPKCIKYNYYLQLSNWLIVTFSLVRSSSNISSISRCQSSWISRKDSWVVVTNSDLLIASSNVSTSRNDGRSCGSAFQQPDNALSSHESQASCCSTDNNRPHCCCHLSFNFGSCWILFPILHNGLADDPPKSLFYWRIRAPPSTQFLGTPE